ncbi:MAG: lysophospholipid acyltransferase family protein [Spirochaetia bacterium]|nr:lysophospholipid acyltransferase family protein [Spirochaetia bacterium]
MARVKMSLWGHGVTRGIKALLHMLCRITKEGVDAVPDEGPLIVVTNHINFLEVPLIYTHLYPRPSSSLVKAETWENPVLGRLANLWSGIPLTRRATDFTALRSAEARLKEGQLLYVAPEGTRSYTGLLQRGNPGVVTLALRSGATIVPVVHFGGERFWHNAKRLRRTPVSLRAGRPFRIKVPSGGVNRRLRQEIVDEVMTYMASLLPEDYRGHYAAEAGSPPGKVEYEYLEFME